MSVIYMLPTPEEMRKIDELIKRDIENGEIELVPEDKTFDFLPKKEDAIRIMSFNIRCSDVGVQTAESRYTLVSETIFKGEPDFTMVPAVSYNGNGWGNVPEYVGDRAEDGTPWSWASHRATIPACTYSENADISIALMAEANSNSACSLYRIDEGENHVLIFPEEEKPKKTSKTGNAVRKAVDKIKGIFKRKPKKKKGDNMFVRFYKNRGVSGVVQLLKDAAAALGGMFGRIGRAFLFEELYISLNVGGKDSADTAIKYGEICSAAFPAMGLFVNKARVKKYNIEIVPDFIFNKTEARLHTKISLRPIKLINAVFVLVFELLFKVVFKLLKHSKAPAEGNVEKQINK